MTCTGTLPLEITQHAIKLIRRRVGVLEAFFGTFFGTFFGADHDDDATCRRRQAMTIHVPVRRR